MRPVLRATLAAGLAAAVVASAGGTALSAQATPPVFEVASIKVNKIGGPGKKRGELTPVGTGGVMNPQGNQFTARNATVRTLVRFAYGTSDNDLSTPPSREEYEVAGGAAWIATEAFDIVAKMPETASRPIGDPALMLRALLVERFALKVHTETRQLPAYSLVRARQDGKPGPGLRVPDGRCVPRTERAVRDQIPCGVRGGFQGIMGTGTSMTRLAAVLSQLLGRMVLDRTTLPGTFDFDLRFIDDTVTDGRFPSLFTALQEQLGLKLEATRAPVDVLVIDSVQRPTDN